MTFSNRDLCNIALLCALITISGAFKIPGLVPGMEFQLSAPIAVAICGVFGIKNYLCAGILSSMIGLILGTQNILNVCIALLFRVVVAVVHFGIGPTRLFYICSGPLGTFLARMALSFIIGKAAYPLVAAAVPGMIFTACTAPFCGKMLALAAKYVAAPGLVSKK
jgi:hypothetical protein